MTTFESTAFEDGARIPTTYTCEGADVSPPLVIGGVPEKTAALAVIVDDPDAPSGTFTHWLLWNLPPATTEIPAGVSPEREVPSLGGARQGTNGFGSVGYRGPCPPRGGGDHRYQFSLYALDASLDVMAGAGTEELVAAMEPGTIGRAEFSGTFGRT